MALLEAQGLVKVYRRRRVVDDVSFHIDSGEVVGLLGPNGAGKSTSFRMAAGMVRPDTGRILFDGNDVTSWPLHRRARDCRMAYLAQDSSVFAGLTVEENLTGIMKLLGFGSRDRRRRAADLLQQFGLTRLAQSRAGRLSGGERRRLEVARTLIINPRLVMLDEPFAGIDPVSVQDIRRIIDDLRSRGISVLITDHQVRETLSSTDRCYVLRSGKVLCHGDAETILRDPEAREHYFGDLSTADVEPSDAARPAA